MKEKKKEEIKQTIYRRQRGGRGVQAAGCGLRCIRWPAVGWQGLSRAKGERTHTQRENNKLWNDWTQLRRDLCFKGEDCLLTKYQKSAQSKRRLRLIVKLHLESKAPNWCLKQLHGWRETEVVIYPHNHWDSSLLGSPHIPGIENAVLPRRASQLNCWGNVEIFCSFLPSQLHLLDTYWALALLHTFHLRISLTKLSQTYPFLFFCDQFAPGLVNWC